MSKPRSQSAIENQLVLEQRMSLRTLQAKILRENRAIYLRESKDMGNGIFVSCDNTVTVRTRNPYSKYYGEHQVTCLVSEYWPTVLTKKG